MSDDDTSHLGVPDAESYSGNLGSWASSIQRALALMNSGDLILAAATLAELKCAIESADQECADAWDKWMLENPHVENEFGQLVPVATPRDNSTP